MNKNHHLQIHGGHLFPFARLCVLQSIWQFPMSVTPPFDHGVTWSASISLNFQMRFAFVSCFGEKRNFCNSVILFNPDPIGF